MRGTRTGQVSRNNSFSLWTGESLLAAATHHRCGPISDLLVLQVGQFTEDLGSWMLHFQQLQDGRSVIGDGHVLSDQQVRVINHIIEMLINLSKL